MDETPLILAQWFSPAFPVGGFAYSHGLECAIADGDVATFGDVRDWVADVLAYGTGMTDAAILGAAMRPGADHASLDATARALCTAEERWIETRDQGAAFTHAVNAVADWADPPRALPVAAGRAAARIGAAPAVTAALYLQSFATNVVLAAVRFLPLGGGEGQRIVASLRPLCLSVAGRGVTMPVAEIASSAIGAEYAAMRHAELPSRMFRT